MKKNYLKIMSLCALISVVNVIPVQAKNKGIYKETGQIELKDYKVDFNEKNEIKSVKKLNEKNERDYKYLVNLCNDKDYSKELIKNLRDKKEVSIGYTTVYLKEVKDEKGFHYEPITVEENNNLLRSSSGDITKYSLTFNLTVTSSDSGTKRTINTSTYMYWKPVINLDGEARVANGSDDYASISYCKPYVISINKTTGGMSGTFATNPYLHEVSEYGAVAAFRENNGGGYMKASSTQTKPSSKKSRRFIAKYVHTWDKIDPSISFGVNTDGVGSVNIAYSTSAKAWQISTYVDHSC